MSLSVAEKATGPVPRNLTGIVAVVMWMCCSTGLIFFNKLILKTLGFKYPVFLTFTQVTTISAGLHIYYLATGRKSPYTTTSTLEYMLYIAPVAAMSSTCIVLRNFIYLYLSVAAMQLIASAAPVVVYVIACVAKLEKVDVRIGVTILFVCVGVGLAVSGPIMAAWQGVVLQVVSMVLDALRAVRLKHFLSMSSARLDSLDILYLMTPISSVLLYIPASFLEFHQVFAYAKNEGPFIYVLLFGNSLTAGALNLTSVWMLREVSVLTTSLSAVFKDCFIIGFSLASGDEDMSMLNITGWALSAAGLSAYAFLRARFAA